MAECLNFHSSESESQEITADDASNAGYNKESDTRLRMLNDVNGVVSLVQELVGNALKILSPQSSDESQEVKGEDAFNVGCTEESDKMLSDVKEVVSLAQVLVSKALTFVSSQTPDESQEIEDGVAAKVVNPSQLMGALLPAISIVNGPGASNLNMANDSGEAEVNFLQKKFNIKADEGAEIEIESSETNIGNKSKMINLNVEGGETNITLGKNSKLTVSNNNNIGNNVSEKAKVDLTFKAFDLNMKQNSEVVITAEMNIANNKNQAEVICEIDRQKFEFGEGSRVNLKSGAGGSITTLQQENQVPESQGAVWGTNAFRVVLLGNTKSGKSSTGNTIINGQMNSNPFGIGKGFNSLTLRCQTEQNYINGFHMTVTDTPGLWNTEETFDVVFSEILKSMEPGPHAILLVIRLGTKFTDEDDMSYLALKWLLGDSVQKYIIVVFVGIDQLCDSELESYEKIKTEINSLLENVPHPLYSLLSDVEHRYIAFNNKASGDVNDRQREELFKMIEQMVHANNHGHFELQINHSSNSLRNYHNTHYYCSCCGSNIPHRCALLGMDRWNGVHWYGIHDRRVCHPRES